MKWFKHISRSGDDKDIEEAVTEFGLAGYYVFFRLLEIMASEVNLENPSELRWSRRGLAIKFRCKWNTVETILRWYQDRGRLVLRMEGEKPKGMIVVKVPKFGELCDDYTVKRLRKSPDNCPDTSPDQPPEKIRSIEKEVESDKETTLLKINPPAQIVRLRSVNGRHFATHVADLIERIDSLCQTLLVKEKSETGRKFNPFQWAQKQATASSHPSAIADTLQYAADHWSEIGNKWAYLNKICLIQSQNAYEAEHIDEHRRIAEEFKTAFDARILNLIKLKEIG